MSLVCRLDIFMRHKLEKKMLAPYVSLEKNPRSNIRKTIKKLMDYS